jgi:CTD kinase subunit beta
MFANAEKAFYSQRTLVALQYPPHVVALACIYLAALLSTFEQTETHAPHNNHEIVATLRDHGPWEVKFQAQVDDLEGERTFSDAICLRSLTVRTSSPPNLAISHALLDLLISQTQNPSASTTPNTPSSPSPHISRAALHIAAPAPHTSDQLMRLKIVMRETEHPPRNRTPTLGDGFHDFPDGADAIGRNEGTVRFLFGPNGGA